MDSLGFGLLIGTVIVVLLVAEAYRRGRRAGMKLARQLDEDPFDETWITKELPWSIVPVQTMRMRLVNSLQDACTTLVDAGFLTDKEIVRIQTRIAVWRTKQTRLAMEQGKPYDACPFCDV